MKKALIALAVVLIAGTGSVQAEERITCPEIDNSNNWSAHGILSSWNKQIDYFKTEYVRVNFDACLKCKRFVDEAAYTKEFIGQGGTNGKVPGVQWNYDATCFDLNAIPEE